MAANTLPISVEMGALPTAVRWTPQQLADAIAERLYLVTAQSFALFVSGSTEPSSNVGPWLKDGLSWWVWDNTSGNYQPQEIGTASLGYIISYVEPDHNIYKVWIQTDALGSPLSIKTYYAGMWIDVYAAQLADYQTVAAMSDYYTKAEVNALVSGVSFATYLAQAGVLTPQVISVDAAAHLVAFDTAILNPSPSPFNLTTKRYVAPASGVYSVSFTAQVSNNSGTAASMQTLIQLFKNGIATNFGAVDGTPSPNGSRWYPKLPNMLISLSVNDYLELWVTLDDGVNSGNCNLEQTYFNVIRASA